METNEKLSELMQKAAVMVNKTALPHEDRVRTLGGLSEALQVSFEKSGIEAAQTRLDVETKAREERFEAHQEKPANPHLI